MINEKVIKLAKIFPVDMKSFETTVKCPTCNAVITEASVGKFVKISFPKGIIHLVLKEDLRSAVLNFIQKKKKIAIYLSWQILIYSSSLAFIVCFVDISLYI